MFADRVEAVDGLSRKFFGIVTEKGRSRTTTNADLIDKSAEKYAILINVRWGW